MAAQISAAGSNLGNYVTRQGETTRAVNDTTAALARQAAGWKALGEAGRQAHLNAQAAARLGSLSSTGAAPSTSQAGRAPRVDEIRNLTFQAGDILSSAASGASPAMILMQQGPQIAQVFGPGGASITGMFKAAGDAATSLAARIGIVGGALGGLTAAAVTAIVAQQSYSSSQRELAQSLAGVGRASGTTVAEVNAMASANAAAAGLSTRQYRELAGVYASTGRIGREMFDGLARTAKDFAATTGQDLADVAQMQAQAFADPSRGADMLNEKLGFLNDRTRETIQRLQAQGDRLGAQRVLLDAYSSSLQKASDLTSGWARITTTAGNAISSFWDTIGQKVDRVLTGGNLDQQLADAQRWAQDARTQRESWLGSLSPGRTADELEAAEANLRRIQALVDQRNKANERASANRNSLVIGDLVRSFDPSRQELKKTEDAAEQLRKAISVPVRWGLDLAQLAAAEQLFQRLSRLARTTADDIARFGDVSVAASVRAAEFNNRTVGFSPVAKEVARGQQRYLDELQARGIDPNGLSSAQIRADYEGRIANADSRDLASLTKSRDEALQNALTREGLARELQLDTDRIKKETYNNSSGRYAISINQVPDRYRDMVYHAANRYGLNADFFASLIKQESGFNPNALSKAGAQGMGQLMPDTARGLGVRNVWDPDENLDASARLLSQLMRQYNQREDLTMIGYNAGPRRVQRFLASGEDISTLPKETQKYIPAITTRPPGLDEQLKAERERTAALELQNRAVQNSTELYGRDAVALEARNAADERLQRDMLAGIPITDEYRKSVYASALATAQASRALASTRLGADLRFEREQLGRTDSEQAAYSRARSAFGDVSSPAAQAAIQQAQLNDNLKQTKDLAKEAFSGFASDMMRGATAAEALNNALQRIIDKLLNKSIDALVSGLFDGIGGGSRGLPTMAQGGYGPDMPSAASAASFFSTISKFFGFADGGYTGAGGRFEPAGIVHRGEYVFDAASVSRVGVGYLEALRGRLRGYADGGYVGPADYPAMPAGAPAPANNNQPAAGPTFIAQITSQSTGDEQADQRAAEANAKAMRAEFERMWMATAQQQMRPGGMLHAAGARRTA
ncbi:phage tail length tape measure family protein [Methylobacterium nodulans]|uniref:phage tail length tape measure family protein n=1 Tax=Methylobacterium nodulans TaxID=114616 RepID=UPI0018DC2E80|nr:phage tail length tape measure family protein [Methylobacterium nodulans]